MSTREQRRAPRRPVDAGIVAIDTIAEQPLGHLCNLSASGLMLIGGRKPRSRRARGASQAIRFACR